MSQPRARSFGALEPTVLDAHPRVQDLRLGLCPREGRLVFGLQPHLSAATIDITLTDARVGEAVLAPSLEVRY